VGGGLMKAPSFQSQQDLFSLNKVFFKLENGCLSVSAFYLQRRLHGLYLEDFHYLQEQRKSSAAVGLLS